MTTYVLMDLEYMESLVTLLRECDFTCDGEKCAIAIRVNN